MTSRNLNSRPADGGYWAYLGGTLPREAELGICSRDGHSRAGALRQLADPQAGLLPGEVLQPVADLPRLDELPEPPPGQDTRQGGGRARFQADGDCMKKVLGKPGCRTTPAPPFPYGRRVTLTPDDRHSLCHMAALPQASIDLDLLEHLSVASHAAVAAIGPVTSKGSGEQSLARRLYPRLEDDWLLIADRNFYNWADCVKHARHRPSVGQSAGERAIFAAQRADGLPCSESRRCSSAGRAAVL